MNRTWIRVVQQLDFRDPEPFLVDLRQLGRKVAASDLPQQVKDLRTNLLKTWREAREAAIFCHGMSAVTGYKVFFARNESQDYDFIASWKADNIQHYSPVQLKKVVPTNLNPAASLQSTINSLTKYADSKDLTVAVYLNQEGPFDPKDVTVPSLKIAALWIFASISEDQSEWGLWGNFLEKPNSFRFRYPT